MMSWWVYLEDHSQPVTCTYGTTPDRTVRRRRDEPCPVPCYPAVQVARHEGGGTYILGGTNEATINVSYNYGAHFRAVMEPPEPGKPNILAQMLNGKRAADVTKVLEHAVERLGTQRDPDYWKATPGNAGYALSILLDWARQYPKAVFRIA